MNPGSGGVPIREIAHQPVRGSVYGALSLTGTCAKERTALMTITSTVDHNTEIDPRDPVVRL